jgi:uncharacterized membrane protein (UPF0127 family)
VVAGLVVPRTGEVIAERVLWARTPRERARGLLGRDALGPGDALILERARQVHTFGMRYPIDVCFCDRAWNVLHVVAPMRPHRVTRWVARAFFVVETRAGRLGALQPGDQLSVVERSER